MARSWRKYELRKRQLIKLQDFANTNCYKLETLP